MHTCGIILLAVSAFALGWWTCRWRMQKKINQMYAQVEAGKIKVQKAIDTNK